MILCKHCDRPIEHIITNFFDRDGSDYDIDYVFHEPEKGVAEIQLPTYWCGYELSEDEMMESIRCPHCGKFPFSESAGINIETIVHVVCFEEGADTVNDTENDTENDNEIT